MNFMDSLNNALNVSTTENGATGYKTTGSKLVDMNFKISSYRDRSEDEIISDFKQAYQENPELAMKWLFYVRDIRKGLGERRLFRVIIKYMLSTYTFHNLDLLFSLIVEYGRWDDTIYLLGISDSLDSFILSSIKGQLQLDLEAMKKHDSVSLLAKWLPSENTSSQATRTLAKRIIKGIGSTPREYRKILSSLRKYSNVVEVKMSSNNWDKIDYFSVPSKANLIYRDAFMRHDPDGRSAYLEAVASGASTINASTLYPHEIIRRYRYLQYEDKSLELLWNNLPNISGELKNTIVVADGSSSMLTRIGKSNVQAIDVCYGLAIYFAERCQAEFKNQYITFSNHPKLVDLSSANCLFDKIKIAKSHTDINNTNIEAVFNLILSTAVRNQMKQEDLPKNILILSDMEFDAATDSGYGFDYDTWTIYQLPKLTIKLFEDIKIRYEERGYKLPRLIFWNICGRTDTIPLTKNELGVSLISGFSTNVMQMIMSDAMDPYQALVEILNSSRYDLVELLFK